MNVAVATDTRRGGRPRKAAPAFRSIDESLESALRALGDPSVLHWPSSRYQQDPVAFAKDVLGETHVWSKQVEILEAIRDHKRVAIRSGHKCSKSRTLAIAALWFYACFPDARVVCTCVTARQIDDILYREIRKLHAQSQRGRHPVDGEPRELARSGIKAADMREIVGYTAKDAEAVAGTSGANVLYLIDEASGVGDPIFEAIEGNRAGGARVVMTSNPTKTDGEFFEAFHSKSRFYKLIHVSSEDTPNARSGKEIIPGLAGLAWIEEKREEWGEESALFRVRVRGEFVTKETGRIISLHAISEAEARWTHAKGDERLQVGLDCAGPGNEGDETAWCSRRGFNAHDLRTMTGLTAEAIVVHTLGYLEQHRKPREIPLLAFDTEGEIGIKVGALLRVHLDANPDAFELIPVKASHQAQREPMIYGTIRDELWASCSAWLRAGGAIPEDAKLAKELHAPEWRSEFSAKRHCEVLKATDKQTLRKLLGRSPDRADALCLAVWAQSAMVLDTTHGTVAASSKAAAALDPYDDPDVSERAVDRVFDPYGGRS